MSELANAELEKLALYAGPGGRVDLEAAMACAGVNPIKRQASEITNCMDSFHAVPGLQSVARARQPPASMIFLAGV